MEADHIESLPGWFDMDWDEPAVVGHRCGFNRFRVTVLTNTYCECGTLIPREIACSL